MGGSFSQDFYSTYADTETAQADVASQENVAPLEMTPTEKVRNMRLLALDPRSPSRLIDRTPIIVARTPDLPCDDTMHPKSVTDSPVIEDPRSPTTEFTRTPINPCLHSSAGARQRILSTPLTSHRVEDPDISESHSDVGSASVSPVLSNMTFSGGPVTSLESLESAIGSDQGSEAVSDQGSEAVSDQGSEAVSDQDVSLLGTDPDLDSLPLDVNVSDEFDEGYDDMDEVSSKVVANKILHRVKSGEEITPKLPAVIRSISHNRIGMKPKMLALTSGVTRSPLSAVGNSPRLLVQRSNKTAVRGKPLHAKSVFQDKENIRH